MKIRVNFCLLYAVAILFGISCSKKPSEVPELYPAKVTVTNGETPISGASVVVSPEQVQGNWSTSGITDSSGVATLRTIYGQWQGPGIPKGEYKVAVSKSPFMEPSKSKEEVLQMAIEERERYFAAEEKRYDALPREIPPNMANLSTSPYYLNVSETGENVLKIDVPQSAKK